MFNSHFLPVSKKTILQGEYNSVDYIMNFTNRFTSELSSSLKTQMTVAKEKIVYDNWLKLDMWMCGNYKN